mmetsp:Transcript_115707/g.367935  ORF Transcript_115707/g.367935 Transcript_115707/m.367935 type:complete len:249 (-) Transcript_115707:900-1646(-)
MRDEDMGVGHLGGFLDAGSARVLVATVGDVVPDAASEQHRLLLHDGHDGPQPRDLHVPDVEAIQLDSTTLRLIEPKQQAHQAAFARAAGPDKCRGRSRRHMERHIIQSLGHRPSGVGEADGFVGDLTHDVLQDDGARHINEQRLVDDFVEATGCRAGRRNGIHPNCHGAQTHREAPKHGEHGGQDAAARPARAEGRGAGPALCLVAREHPRGAGVEANGHGERDHPHDGADAESLHDTHDDALRLRLH